MHPIFDVKVSKKSAAVHWFGQSSYAFKGASGELVLIDPYFPRVRPPERFIHPEPPVDEAEIPAALVLLTHDHRDHTCIETLGRVRKASPGARYVGPVESVRHIADAGVPAEETIVIQAGESLTVGSVVVHAVYAKPPEGDPEAGINPPDVTHLGYVVDLDGIRLYFTGDPINTFARRDDLIEPVRALKPDVGFFTTHPTEGEFPFFDGSREMARKIGVRKAVPAHYQCFVKRNYDPAAWAEGFGPGDPEPLIIGYNQMVVLEAGA